MLCPKCGKEVEEDAKFCGYCGAALEPIKGEEVRRRFCPKCGAELREGENFCNACGTKVGEVGTEVVVTGNYPHMLATIFGYIFAVLGGWIGIVFGIYLWTREHPRAKFHGKIILLIDIIIIFFAILAIIHGA